MEVGIAKKANAMPYKVVALSSAFFAPKTLKKKENLKRRERMKRKYGKVKCPVCNTWIRHLYNPKTGRGDGGECACTDGLNN